MGEIDQFLPDDWGTDGFGLSAILICPHGNRIEQDGEGPCGCVSPLKQKGMI